MGSTPTSIRCLYAISIWILIYSYIDLLWFLFVPSTQIALRQQHPNDAQWNIRQSTQHSNAVWNPINWLYKGHLERIPMKMIIFFFKCFSRHLGRNPFLCDCYLTWLADYLHRKPVETSGVRCESPRRMQRRRISVLRDEKSRCSGKFKWKAPDSNARRLITRLIEMLNYLHLNVMIYRSWLGAQFAGNQSLRRWSILSNGVFLQRNHCWLFK